MRVALRRLRLGGSRRRRVLGAVALRPAADVARRRRRGHRGWLRHAGRSRGPLRPRAGLARAPARGRPRGGRRRDRDRMVVRDGGRDRAARGGARSGPAGDRHGALVALRGVRGDHPRCDGGARRAASLARAVDRDRRRRRRSGCAARSRCRRVGRSRHHRRPRLVRAGRARGGGLAAARLRHDGSRSARELVRARRRRPRAPARAAALGRRPQPGLALAGAAVVWAGAWLALRRVQPALALVLGVSSLSLAAVATADLLSGTSLAITWAAEALLLSFVALRVRDARLQATALVYCAITAAHVLLVDAPPKLIFEEPVPGMAAASVAALALALLGAGILAPAEAVARTETGLLAWLAPVRVWLAAHRVGLQEGLVLGGAAAGTYAVAILLTAYSFRTGHLAATIVAATVGAVRRGDLVAAWLRRARRGVARLGRRRVRHRHGLRCARVRGRGDPPLVRRLGADRRLGRRARRLLRLPAPLPWRAPHRRPGRRRRPRARRSRSRHRPHLAGRRRARVDLDRLAAARADALSSSASRRACSAFPVIAISRRSCGRSVRSRSSAASGSSCATRRGAPLPSRSPRPSSACSPGPCGSSGSGSPAGSSGAGRHSSPSSFSPGSGPSTAPSRCATRSPGSRPRPPSWSSARSRGETRRGAISSRSPGRPRSSR